jgi:hypothetical protein
MNFQICELWLCKSEKWAIKYGENQEKNRGWLMTMLRVLLQGPGCISIYEWCGCAKKKKKQKIGDG